MATTPQNTSLAGVLAAADPEGDGLAFSIVSPVSHGTLALTDPSTGEYTYQPAMGFTGVDSFSYRVADAGGASAAASQTLFVTAASPHWPGQTVRVSVHSDGREATVVGNESMYPTMSADGRFVAFRSGAPLVPEDSNGASDVFVHDRATGSVSRVSIATGGQQGNHNSSTAEISADGRFVAFGAAASNLVADDTNGAEDVFVHDRVSGETRRVSVATDGTQGNGGSFHATISADGRRVAFASSASNLVQNDTNNTVDVFVHDLVDQSTVRVSAGGSDESNGPSAWPALDGAGRRVVFESSASNLVAGDTNGQRDIFAYDLDTGVTRRVSVTSSGAQGNNFSLWTKISADGGYVVFASQASNLVAGDTNGSLDIFRHDLASGATTRINVTADGTPANLSSSYSAASADGRFIAFASSASNLVTGDTNNQQDVFVKDTLTGELRRVSVASDGTQADGTQLLLSISDDGRFVAFESPATTLVPGDTNNIYDTFVVGGVHVDAAAMSFGRQGGSASVNVLFAYPGTIWGTSSGAPWATATGGANGNGTATIAVA
ncbi:MAG TPA: Ig-like domain-containing protein, partial [Mycobacterium sp.]|nr:Ig-like domain-containing protein [Mycobacterium sp.]